jgi:hypothetical protein
MWKSGKYVAMVIVGAGLAVAANAPASAHGYKHGYYGHARGEAAVTTFRPRNPCLRIPDWQIKNHLRCLQEAHKAARDFVYVRYGIRLPSDHDLIIWDRGQAAPVAARRMPYYGRR